ncbi:RagB/SusD family nutrient uptake outer membrane protein [Persicobacter diffluens]|uniref:Membrane protein n=1 Tax=Persicobacter diffluens TaxID=981 RepID=A0AAN4W2E5_9BACT|nr:membrane protein [Persicobacter diffluens]
MKRYNFFAFVLLFGLLAACSEDFLDRPPRDEAGSDFLNGGDQNATVITNAAYSSLQKNGLYARLLVLATQSRSDESRVTKNTPKMEEDGMAAASYTNNASGKVGEMIWRDSFNGIFRANVALDYVKDNENVNEKLRKRLAGEAYFLRAMYYLNVVMLYGEIVPECRDSKSVLNPPFEHEDNVWNMMIEDLTNAQELFEEVDFTNLTWAADDRGRANLGAATALLGKVYLYYAQMRKNNDPELINKAKAELFKVYNQQVGAYALTYNYLDNFRSATEYNEESIFEVGFADYGQKIWEIDQDNAGASETNFLAKSSTMCDGVGLMWWNESPSARIYNEYERFGEEIIDYRCYYTMWIPGGAYFNDYEFGTLKDRVLSYEDSPWPNKENNPVSTIWGKEYDDYRFYGWRKYGYDYNFWLKDGIDPNNTTGSDINYRYMRYADVLLLLAECEAYLGGDAFTYIDQVRDRANHQLDAIEDPGQADWGNTELPYFAAEGRLPKAVLSIYRDNPIAAVQHERMVELACESARYFDIIRWDAAGVLLDLRKEGFPRAQADDVIIDPAFDGNFLFPIPQSELNNNKYMRPNSAN